MRRFAFALLAAVLALSAARPEARADAPAAPCPVTVHVSNSGGLSVSNCKGGRETSDEDFHEGLKVSLAEAGDPSMVIFDADPETSLYDIMNAMNWVQDVGVFDFQVIDEAGRAPFTISMPSPPEPDIVVYDHEPTDAEMAKDDADGPEKPRFIMVRIRPDHRLDVYDMIGPPMRPEGLAMAKRDRKEPQTYITKGVKMEDLPLLMPAPNSRDFAVVHGQKKTPWREIRVVYRVFSASGFGRLISEEPIF